MASKIVRLILIYRHDLLCSFCWLLYHKFSNNWAKFLSFADLNTNLISTNQPRKFKRGRLLCFLICLLKIVKQKEKLTVGSESGLTVC